MRHPAVRRHLLEGSMACLLAAAACTAPPPPRQAAPAPPVPGAQVDHHVHVLGPGLLRDWKSLGVPFSRPDSVYISASALLEEGLSQALLVPMAHLYARQSFREALGLTVDEEHARVRSENDHVAREAARFPGRAVPLCSVDLLRPYAWDEIRRCRSELGVPGIKLHLASAGTDLRDAAHLREIERFAAWAEQERVAVLLHFDPQRRGLEVVDVERFLDVVLTPHPDLEITIAHLGGSGGYGPWTQAVFGTFVRWIETRANPGDLRPGVSFDLSAVVLEEESEGVPATTPAEGARLTEDLRRAGLDRILFASDYPVFDPQRYARLLAERTGLTSAELNRLLRNRARVLTRSLAAPSAAVAGPPSAPF